MTSNTNNYIKYYKEANKLNAVDPVVAYFCKLYAIEVAMKIPQKTTQVKTFLSQTMDEMESNQTDTYSSEEGNTHVYNMASQIFNHADNMDRDGLADKSTVQAFLSAATLFEVMQQFGELSPEIKQKLKYAKWKAIDIHKALSQGRKPSPGAYDEQQMMPSLETEQNISQQPNCTSNQNNSNASIPDAANINGFSLDQSYKHLPSTISLSNSSSASVDLTNLAQQLSSSMSFSAPKAVDQMPTQSSQPPPSKVGHLMYPSMSTLQQPAVQYNPSSTTYSVSQSQSIVTPQHTLNVVASNASSTPAFIHAETPASSSFQKPHMPSNTPAAPVNAASLSALENQIVICESASKLVRHSLSALNFQDIPTAVHKLKEALSMLIPLDPSNK